MRDNLSNVAIFERGRGRGQAGWPESGGRPLLGYLTVVKAVIKFAMDTEKLTHNIESETEGLVDEQRREMDDRAAGATQAY